MKVEIYHFFHDFQQTTYWYTVQTPVSMFFILYSSKISDPHLWDMQENKLFNLEGDTIYSKRRVLSFKLEMVLT